MNITHAQALGEQPVDAARLPGINIATPSISTIARSIINNIPKDKLFRRKDSYVTITVSQTSDGTRRVETRPMTANRLCSWLEDYVCFQSGSGDKIKKIMLGKPLAEKILASDILYERCPVLGELLPVRLPVWTKTRDGRRSVTLAKPGYDPASRAYTVETIDYLTGTPERYTPREIRQIWAKLTYEFPWRAEAEIENRACWKLGPDTIVGIDPTQNRSACCTLALMLGQYCRLLIGGMQPMGIFNANQAGSGKTLLAWLAITPVWGRPPASPTPKNEEELQKSLNAALIACKPYLLLDDIPSLANNTINMIATAPEISSRNLGSYESFFVENRMQILATGNGLSTTPDVERRSLIVDLFLEEEALGRKFSSPLRKEDLPHLGVRSDLLRFLWAMVQNWIAEGCPMTTDESAKASYESYAAVIGSIMKCNGFGNPFRARQTDGTGGDIIGRTLNAFLARVVGDVMYEAGETTRTYNLDDLLALVDKYGYREQLCTSADPKKSLGKKLVNLRGRKLKDTRGRTYIFGRGESAGCSHYTFVVEPDTK